MNLLKDKKKCFKTNDDYFKFYAKMKEKINIKSVRLTGNNIVVVYDDIKL